MLRPRVQVALGVERYALLSEKLAAEAARGGALEADVAAAAARGDALAAESAERLARIDALVPALERVKASKVRAPRALRLKPNWGTPLLSHSKRTVIRACRNSWTARTWS